MGNNINKYSIGNGTHSTVIENTDLWKPQCVCFSSDGDLLIGIMMYDSIKNIHSDARVLRYDSTGKETQVIEHDNTGQKLYCHPLYITENHNGDVIVSDLKNCVVVTDCEGWRRFSYKGPPSGSRLSSRGVCVDALSQILVCDCGSNTIQIISKDGHFLSMFSIINNMFVSGGLEYDKKNHLLLVGTTDYNSVVCVYRYIQRKDYFTDDFS
ncbi:uncharacterized protein LOC134263290 [Saccostrea cucullata]|uniref:uncharacterized protein LOC134263290 n=1 Tax=Saccostrea cuccullata TaxID=36930 RepID=UPI002ECFE056